MLMQWKTVLVYVAHQNGSNPKTECRVPLQLIRRKLESMAWIKDGEIFNVSSKRGGVDQFACCCYGGGDKQTRRKVVANTSVVLLSCEDMLPERVDFVSHQTWFPERLETTLDIVLDGGRRSQLNSSVILHGRNGSGKSTSVYALAKKCGLPVLLFKPWLLYVITVNDAEESLKEYLKLAQALSPCIFLFEDIDNFEHHFINAKRAILMLKGFLESVAGGGILTVMTTCRLSNVNRMILETVLSVVEMQIPDDDMKREKFRIVKYMPMERMLLETRGFTFGELTHYLSIVEEEERDGVLNSSRAKKTIAELRGATSSVEELSSKLCVSWDALGGLKREKKEVKEAIYWCFRNSQYLEELGISSPSGIMLYGPPGTGKTLLAQAVASECDANFLSVALPDILRGEIGESEKILTSMFSRAKEIAPCILFFDEVEALFSNRESGSTQQLVSLLMQELDEIKNVSGVAILANTNLPWVLEKSLLRSGRIETHIYVGPPDKDDRFCILSVLCKNLRLDEDVDLQEIATKCKGFTGADLSSLLRKSEINASFRQEQETDGASSSAIGINDIRKALSETTASVSAAMVRSFEEYRARRDQ
eukprot:Nk52_evm31s2367 gene=Nk52_evmTU31s2367